MVRRGGRRPAAGCGPTHPGRRLARWLGNGQFLGWQDQDHGRRYVFPGGQGRLPVGADQHGGYASLIDERLPDLLAVQERFQRRTVEDFLGPVGLDRGGAVKLQGPSGRVQDQIAAEQPVLRDARPPSRNPKAGLDLASVLLMAAVDSAKIFANLRIFFTSIWQCRLPPGASGDAEAMTLGIRDCGLITETGVGDGRRGKRFIHSVCLQKC